MRQLQAGALINFARTQDRCYDLRVTIAGRLQGVLIGGALSTGLLSWALAQAGEIQKRPIGPLQEAIYGFAVAEYCGFLSPAVAEGFHLERAWIMARDGISEEEEHDHRIAAILAADWQYGDHGLGGYRGWCRSDGLTAVHRFLSFRDAILGK